MIPWRSIRFGLSAVFLLFLVLMTVLGVFAITELRAVDRVSSEIRDRWLQSTRLLGDLNNFTSDARTAEADRLLAGTSAERGEVDRQLTDLDRRIQQSESDYLHIPHDAEEAALYRRFILAWRAYEASASQVLRLSLDGQNVRAAQVYMTASSKANDAASDALGALTQRTVVRAGEASLQAGRTYRTARALILGLIAVAGLSLVAAIHYIIRFISEPLLGLAQRMRALAANDTSIAVSGADRRDEIGEMARAVVVFRNNAVELAHSQRGLAQQASMLEERLEAEQKLTSLQRNFVSMASHEFRTPLTAIDGHAQRLTSLRARLTPDEIAERTGRIRAAVQRMTHVIERLLDASRLFDGDAALYFHPTSLDPAALLREVCRQHREISPGARIIEDLAGLPPVTVGDPKLLFQAFSNLLANAVKYSPDGRPIRLTGALEAGRLVVSVEDRGLGIPHADLARLFERYHRGSNVTGIVGTGVGLYLVRMVVDLHAGQITVDSREGEGSRFVVSLPRPG